MTLFINACVRGDSRTRKLADYLLSKIDGQIEEICLSEISFPVADERFLKYRDGLIATERYDDPLFGMARQFARAEQIVIAAPYWDLSFPASLKQYFEQINVLGITFVYTEDGYPQGLCHAKKLYYVTTAGGQYVPEEYGFGYVKALSQGFYGIENLVQVRAVGLDVAGADTDGIMREAIDSIDALPEDL